MEIFKKVVLFFKKRYWLFLLLIVVISYGQMIQMLPWQDDNALFFKLANIEGRAGYLGAGPLGEGAYKYTAAFYLPIYLLFGFRTEFYFAYTLLLYFLATLAIYKSVSLILAKEAGRVASFLFACGYIASDGFIRLYNSAATSTSIIFASLLFLFYWNFYKYKKIYFWIGTIVFYFLSVELIRYRAHYMVVVPISFEIIFLMFRKPIRLKSIIFSLVRMLPFVFIFYSYFIANADSRTGQLGILFSSLIDGKFYNLFSFFSSISNIIFPDYFTNIVYNHLGFTIFILIVSLGTLLFSRKIKGIHLILLLSSLVWYFFSKSILSTPILNLTGINKFTFFLGGAIVIWTFGLLFRVKGEVKKSVLFLFIWLIVNIASYAAYDQTVFYNTINRYFAHSFFALSLIFSIIFLYLKKKGGVFSRIGVIMVILWGVGNLMASFNYQHNFVASKSLPVRRFYEELQSYLPEIKKGDILYFDVASNARSFFADAFSVAQMPEETAIAWRYGVDRYDFRRLTDFNEVMTVIQSGKFGDINDRDLKVNNVYSFFYSNGELTNTTLFFNEYLKGTDYQVGNIDDGLPAYTPTRLRLTIGAISEVDKFPLGDSSLLSKNEIYSNLNLRMQAFDYLNYKKSLLQTAKVESSSDWRENVITNILDGNSNTVWQPDRILWHDGNQFLQIDLGKTENIDTFVWVNAYENNSPISYALQVSTDGKVWNKVFETKSVLRIGAGARQIIKFEKQDIRHIRFYLLASLNDDSPGISEAWVVSSEFSNLNVNKMEDFLRQPFLYIANYEEYQATLLKLGYKGKVQIYWKTDASDLWQTAFESSVELIYDGKERQYEVLLPTRGTKIRDLKFDDSHIPGRINLTKLEWKK